MNIRKIVLTVIIGVAVFGLWHQLKSDWILALYAIILALYPNEIKEFIEMLTRRFEGRERIRVSYAYLFRIHVENLYLLVKDEQGRDTYHPVGGVYKYDSNKIDIADKFDGEYDGLFSLNEDTERDLRLKISKKKLNDFNKWFLSSKERENANNLCREFKEELIQKNILPLDSFHRLKYQYIGSVTLPSKNRELRMNQVHHFDVFDIRFTSEQRRQIIELRNNLDVAQNNFVFASEDDIVDGKISFAGKTYRIADTSKYILVANAQTLEKQLNLPDEICASVKDAFKV